MADRETKIEEFVAITGASREIAKSLLTVCNDNLEMAINMQMEGVQVEKDPEPMVSNNLEHQPGTSSAASSSRRQPAPRVVEDEYDEDGVRKPIPQKQETLIQPGFEGYAMNRSASNRGSRTSRVRSVFDGFRNFSNEARSYENGAAGGQGGAASRRGKKRTLEELFKPPIDIIFKGDLQTARDSATSAKKWLLVNIQDACEFQCQVLNRDVWSNEAVKTILREHFIFWQQYKENEEAQRYVTFYPVSEWPYVAILDPRTGELMVTWQKLDAATFCDLVTEFLSLHPNLEPSEEKDASDKNNDDNDKNKNNGSMAKRRKSADANCILDADEDDQMAAAIAASLKETTQSTSKVLGTNSDSDDSDAEFFEESFSAENSNSAPTLPSFSSKNYAKLVESAKTETNTKVESKKGDACSSSWEIYLGSKEDPLSSIMIRFPDGNRVTKEIPCSSQFLAIVEYVKSEGFDLDKHEIVTNFPRRILTDVDTKQTLKELGLFPKEMVIVQQK